MGQALEAAEVQAAVPRRPGVGRRRGREAADEPTRATCPSSRASAARGEVGAAAEGHVLVGVGPAEVELVGGRAPLRRVRLDDANPASTKVRAGMVRPPISSGSMVIRRENCTGES